MTSFLLHASVALAWFVDQPIPAYALRVRAALLKGVRATVPPLWQLEMANGLVVTERRRILPPSEVDLALQQVELLMGNSLEVSAEFVSLAQVFMVARRFRLSAYDAVYLETARRLHLAIATLDRSLSSAARSAGIEIFQ